MDATGKIGVLFVCLGNICRSPTAEGVFRALALDRGIADQLTIDSAGTGSYHVGEPPHADTQDAARKRGIELKLLRARQVMPEDFYAFDYVLAMDKSNERSLESMRPSDAKSHLGLFLKFAKYGRTLEVPDPYGGGPNGFENVLDLIEDGAEGLMDHIQKHHSLVRT